MHGTEAPSEWVQRWAHLIPGSITEGLAHAPTGNTPLISVEHPTGEFTVELEIDRKYWNGQNVKPENTVKLVVEVDKDFLKTEYEVDAPVEVLK